MNRVEKAIRYIPCPTCRAKPKRPCSTRTGNLYAGTWFAHDARLEPFVEEFWNGYRFARKARVKVSA